MSTILKEDVRNYDLNLERIDFEIRMEKIRQNSTKLSWDGFTYSVRRNLLEKRIGFDAEGRLDVLQAISNMTKRMPVDGEKSLLHQLRQLCASLECSIIEYSTGVAFKGSDLTIELGMEEDEISVCKISYWDGPLDETNLGLALLRNRDINTFRSAVFSILNIMPAGVTSECKKICKEAFRALEQHLMLHANEPSFEAINSSPYGFYSPRTPLRPGRLYFVVEPSFTQRVHGLKTHADLADLENLPYLELAFISTDREYLLPRYSSNGVWENFQKANVCLCLRFSSAMLFSQTTQRLLEPYVARSALVRHYCNLYRYMGNRENMTKNLILRTRLPEDFIQHRYEVDAQSLKNENDPVVVEMYLKDFRQLNEVVAIIRSEWRHNSLWESILAMSYGEWRGSDTLRILTVPTRRRFEFAFPVSSTLIKVVIEEGERCQWVIRTTTYDGLPVSKELDFVMTERLARSWSIPCTLAVAVQELGCVASPDAHELSESFDQLSSSLNCVKSKRVVMDKVGSAWLNAPALNKSDFCSLAKPKYEMDGSAEYGGLLASFKEVDEQFKVAPPLPRAEFRGKRIQSDNTISANVFSDLEKIRQLAETVEDDGLSSSGPMFGSRMSLDSPAIPLRPSNLTQLSPLESARLKMAQSMSVATAVGLASCNPTPTSAAGIAGIGPEIFDFPDERSPSSGFSSPSPHLNQQYMQHPLGQPPVRGAGKTRRPRARKAANMGDRLSSDSLNVSPSTPTRGRGRGRGRGTGSRKPPAHPQVDFGDPRPQLQRSFSDFPHQLGSFPSTPQHMGSPAGNYAEDDSDDECDPPPPPKPQGGGLPPVYPQPYGRPSLMQQSPSLQMMSPFGNIAHSPNTPSPLSLTRAERSEPKSEMRDVKPSLLDSGAYQMPRDASASSILQQQPPNQFSHLQQLQMQRQIKQEPSESSSQPALQWPVPTRKSSLEAVITKCRAIQPNPRHATTFSDLYDDGTEETPPPSDQKVFPSGSQPGRSAPTQQFFGTSSAVPSSPKESSNDSTSSKLKKPAPARNSPSLEAQKAKSAPLIPKIEKQEKPKKDRKMSKEQRSSQKPSASTPTPGTEPKKRKHDTAKKDPKEKDPREPREKKPKVKSSTKIDPSSPSTSAPSTKLSSNVPAIINPLTMTASLKNFRIPKKETMEDAKEQISSKEVKESAKEPPAVVVPQAPVVPSAPAPPTSSVPTPSSSSSLPPPPTASLPSEFHPGNFGAFAGPAISTTKKKGPALHIQIPGPLGGPARGPRIKPPNLSEHMRDRRSSSSIFPRAGPPPPAPYFMNHPPQQKVASYAQGLAGAQSSAAAAQPTTPSGSFVSGQWVRPPSARGDEGKREEKKTKPTEPGSPEDSLRIADD